MFEHWQSEPPAATSLALLLGAFTDWEPKRRGPRPNDTPIEGVDYHEQTGTTFDNLPLTIQAFLQSTRSTPHK